MFSVYGKSGRTFRGSMEELRQVGSISRSARTHAVAAVGQDPQDQNPQRFAELVPPVPSDIAHKTALAAYEQTRHPGLPRQPLTRVDAVMSSPVITIEETSTVEHAWQMLAQNHLGQAPVVDARGVLIGLITRADLMRPERMPGPDSHALVWRALLMQSVVDLMWTPVPSVSVDTDIRRVARVLLDSGLPGLAVADDEGRVTGFVSRSDILRAVVADPPLDLWT